ncbi:hypothetical protein OPT61_g4219 [Boeremia exigua]|uniref:Uncharacterized protein n=1 Tax=Boeremia exigua TaxID=749465 RepID=A0ACC2IEW2_9PLEO|nr:hypothetical protein OPT61_g4219 [Boeremia exigua]
MSQTRYPQFVWQQTKPGHWEREIDEAERFYTCLAKSFEVSGRMFFAITGFVSISVEITDSSTDKEVEEALRKAWLRLRYDCPTIGSHVDYNSEKGKYIKSYTAFDPEHLELHTKSWLSKTFVPLNPNMSGLDWCNSDPPAPKIPTLFIMTPPSTSGSERHVVYRDIVLRSPHDISKYCKAHAHQQATDQGTLVVDGIGTLQLLNKLLQYAAQYHENPSSFELPPPGSESQNLSPPLRVAASIPPILTLDEQKRLQSVISRNAELREDVELLTVPFTQGQVVPGKHQRTALALSSVDTARVLQACKELGATVTHVYHASIALIIRDLQPPRPQSRTARYINYCLVNERPQCDAPYNSSDYAASVYHSVSGNSLTLDLTIPSITDSSDQNYANPKVARMEFRTLTKQVRDFYTSIRNAPENLALAPAFWSMGTPDVLNPTSESSSVPPPNPSPSVSISSMGNLDKVVAPQYGAFGAKDPWVTGEELGSGIGVFLGTWQGRLQLSAAYNEAWHDREEVRGFLMGCSETAWRGLGLGDDAGGEPQTEWLH